VYSLLYVIFSFRVVKIATFIKMVRVRDAIEKDLFFYVEAAGKTSGNNLMIPLFVTFVLQTGQ
jgi:hypothetical protein